ncbi:uncharacterized protein LOC110007278 isoform X1 [Amborella trichopoda]|uniref:uncharacterized protein LOC110007278 isoform X1 n=1 Tax=Amborella trichopoda TaxID=13333 RepID=UPI0009C13C73|nr:uncharacterized protein LOC110007278 isoform X1 [Amborella trichopoda]|eukprot:XP_020522924.1 uncharacterized protein LOC110007278 isoform X1 [Amborella trichopoda]
MLEAIGTRKTFMTTIEKAKKVVVYLYSHTQVLVMMRKFIKNKDLVRPWVTRFATSCLSLQSLFEQKEKVRSMFVFEDWAKSNWSKKDDKRVVVDIIMDSRFWNKVQYALLVFHPLVNVLKMFDAEKKLAMGHIYKARQDAKEEINRSLWDEKWYREFLKIIEDKWNSQLEMPLHLAEYYLNAAHFYTDAEVYSRPEFMDAFNQCNVKLNPDREVQDKAMMELDLYRLGTGSLGKEVAVRQSYKIPPCAWQMGHCGSTPHLRQMAMKIQICLAALVDVSATSAPLKWCIHRRGTD